MTSSDAPPSTPASAVIVSFDRSDAVGLVRLDDGTELRFGISAMKGRPPVVDVRVTVTEVASHPLGGWRVKRMEIPRSELGRYRTLLEQAEVAAREEHDTRQDQPRPEAQPKVDRALQQRIAAANAARAADYEGRQRHALVAERKRAYGAIAERGWDEQRAQGWAQDQLRGTKIERLTERVTTAMRLAAFPDDGARLVSQLGGVPHMEPELEWPHNDEGPLAFVAQIDLVELKASLGASVLPEHGRLLFFYDAMNEPEGDERGLASARVIHDPSPCRSPRSAPDGAWAFPAAHLRFYSAMFVVPPDDLDEERGEHVEFEGFLAMIEELDSLDTRHQLLGQAQPLSEELDIPNDATLLLQLDADPATNMEWGDHGRLYFWIDNEDLARGDFTRVRSSLQRS